MPLGGYVKMAGENPEDARTGAPDEFLSKTKWQRFQVLVMGPVMNLGARLRGDGGRAVPGRAGPALRTAAGRRRRGHRRIVGREAAGFQPAIASSRSTATRSTPGSSSSMRSARRPNANGHARDRSRGGSTVDLTSRCRRQTGKYEIGDIGVLPNVHPQIVAVNPASRPRGRAEARRRRPRGRTARRTSRATAWWR